MLELMLEKALRNNLSRFKGSMTLDEIGEEFQKRAVIRKRRYRYRCPCCNAKDIVYQWRNSYMKDSRWFCFCGWTEKPDRNSTLREWRKGDGFHSH